MPWARPASARPGETQTGRARRSPRGAGGPPQRSAHTHTTPAQAPHLALKGRVSPFSAARGDALAPAAAAPQPRIAPQLAAAGAGGGGSLTRPPLGWEVSKTKSPG